MPGSSPGLILTPNLLLKKSEKNASLQLQVQGSPLPNTWPMFT